MKFLILFLLPAYSFAQDFKDYSNYDFTPGNTIIFEDHFTDDALNTSPLHWKVGKGTAGIQLIDSQKCIALLSGNYAHISPVINKQAYLGEDFTIEFDCYTDGGYGPHFYFYDNSDNALNAEHDMAQVDVNKGNIWTTIGVTSVKINLDVSENYPEDIAKNEFKSKWHHMAISFQNKQLKFYIDAYRILTVADLGYTPNAFDVEGIGDEEQPVYIANFRVAQGSGLKLVNNKIITHGIYFDVDKSVIRAESMGTLNNILQMMKSNPVLKFEVDGHTDNSGAAPHNLSLSQQRAEAVKTQLIKMGIDAGRLLSKGLGSTKPISDNKTFEGRANNRRVEFVKM